MSESKVKEAAVEAERVQQEAVREQIIETLDGVDCNFLVIVQGKHATQCLVGGGGKMPLTMAAELLQTLARGFYARLLSKEEVFALQHIAKQVNNRGAATEDQDSPPPVADDSRILTRGNSGGRAPLLDAKGKPILN